MVVPKVFISQNDSVMRGIILNKSFSCIFVKHSHTMIDIKPLKIVHASFCFSIFLFGIVTCIINRDLLVFDFTLSHPDMNLNIFSFVAVVFTVLAMNLGTYLFKKSISQIDPLSTVEEKFSRYQTAFLIKCAFLEAAALFCIVMCFITYNFYFIVVASFSLLAMWLMKPSREKVFATLQIQDSDLF